MKRRGKLMPFVHFAPPHDGGSIIYHTVLVDYCYF